MHQTGIPTNPIVGRILPLPAISLQPQRNDTILSPAHVMWSSPAISSWRQSGSKNPSVTDTLSFLDSNGNDLLVLPLTTQNGLQYCSNAPTPPIGMRSTFTYSAALVSAASTARRVLESELWAARLGYCSEWQLTKIPLHADGTPSKFFPHPLRFIDHKELGLLRYGALERCGFIFVLAGTGSCWSMKKMKQKAIIAQTQTHPTSDRRPNNINSPPISHSSGKFPIQQTEVSYNCTVRCR